MPTRPYNDARTRLSSARVIKPFGREDVTPRMVHEECPNWRFERTPDGRWKWLRIDANQGLTSDSKRSFATYEACAADAAGAGYRPMRTADNLVTLSLSHEAPPIPRVLTLGPDELSPEHARRSPVLKKRVIHPAIERMFVSRRSAAVTRTRTAVLSRASSPKTAVKTPQPPRNKN